VLLGAKLTLGLKLSLGTPLGSRLGAALGSILSLGAALGLKVSVGDVLGVIDGEEVFLHEGRHVAGQKKFNLLPEGLNFFLHRIFGFFATYVLQLLARLPSKNTLQEFSQGPRGLHSSLHCSGQKNETFFFLFFILFLLSFL
jgi:hypothetical protein